MDLSNALSRAGFCEEEARPRPASGPPACQQDGRLGPRPSYLRIRRSTEPAARASQADDILLAADPECAGALTLAQFVRGMPPPPPPSLLLPLPMSLLYTVPRSPKPEPRAPGPRVPIPPRRRSSRRCAARRRGAHTPAISPLSADFLTESVVERFAKTLRQKSATFERNVCARHTFW